jgi:hypothetical protein
MNDRDSLFSRIILPVLFLWVIMWFTVGLCAAEGKWVTAEVTAYCPCALCCGDSADGLTANMTRVARGTKTSANAKQ